MAASADPKQPSEGITPSCISSTPESLPAIINRLKATGGKASPRQMREASSRNILQQPVENLECETPMPQAHRYDLPYDNIISLLSRGPERDSQKSCKFATNAAEAGSVPVCGFQMIDPLAPPKHLRHVIVPDIWRRLSLLEKIAVVQLGLGGCTFLLLVVLVIQS